MDYSDFSNFLNERMRERNIGFKRLSELTGVSVKHLEDLSSGDPSRLPPAPYLKGYLTRLGEILDFDHNQAWEEMKKLAESKSSGKSDEPPRNRFSREPISKYMVGGIIIFFLLLYASSRFYEISGTPSLTILSPRDSLSTENSVLFAGTVSNASGLEINGEQIQIQRDGSWQKQVSLQQGLNTFEIKAKKFLGRETKTIRQIDYQPAPANAGRHASLPPTGTGTSTKPTEVPKTEEF